jgi:hypothetical protein
VSDEYPGGPWRGLSARPPGHDDKLLSDDNKDASVGAMTIRCYRRLGERDPPQPSFGVLLGEDRARKPAHARNRGEGTTRQMKLNLQQLEAHLWGAANILRGKTAGQDYKNYILSLRPVGVRGRRCHRRTRAPAGPHLQREGEGTLPQAR